MKKSTDVYDEVTYIIPKNQALNFCSFFKELDERIEEFDIRSYGVAMANLEDVFLQINQEVVPDLFGDLRHISEYS